MPTLDIEEKSDFSRLRCPNNHSAIGPTNHHWYCKTCASLPDPDIDPEFDRVRDAKTGYTYNRDEVDIDMTVSGLYYA